MATFDDAKRDAADLAKLVNEDTDVTTRYGTNPKVSAPKAIRLIESSGADTVSQIQTDAANAIATLNTSRGFRIVGDFASGFTYELPNDVAIDGSGNYWAYADINALPVTVPAGTVPTEGEYSQRTWNEASAVVTTAGINAQQFIDNFELKIFQSPTDKLKKIETFAGGVGVVYEVRKTSDNTLATIYSDKDGLTSIPQNGAANVSDGNAEVVFYIDNGSYTITINSDSSSFNVGSGILDSLLDLPSLSGRVEEGQRVAWKGDAVPLDGGSNSGVVKIGAHVADNVTIFTIDANTYVACKLKTVSDYGITATTTPEFNSAVIQKSLDEQAALLIDVNFEWNQQIIVPNNVIWKSVGRRKSITWTGAAGVYSMVRKETDALYFLVMENLRINGSAGQYIFDGYRSRYCSFKDVQMRGAKISMTLGSCYYNYYESCDFVGNSSGEVGSKSVEFKFFAGETFNLMNEIVFVNCRLHSTEENLRLEVGGEGVKFDTCSMEDSKRAVTFTGAGGSKGLVFETCYLEGADEGNIIVDKTGGGNYLGVSFRNCYYGTESTANAGIIEFKALNGDTHEFEFVNSVMRSFAGYPVKNVLMDCEAATMANCWIRWHNNGETTDNLIPPFDAAQVDWRYLDTDVAYKLTYSTDLPGITFETAFTRGDIYIKKQGFYDAEITGTVKGVGNASVIARDVTDAIPASLRPPSYVQFAGNYIESSSGDTATAAFSIVSGKVRAYLDNEKPMYLNARYPLSIGRKMIHFVD